MENKIKKMKRSGAIRNTVLLCIATLAISGAAFVYWTSCKTTDDVASISDDYYERCNFDFIIPKPWYTQISEIKNMKFVDGIVPYFITEKKLTTKGRSIKVDLYIVEKDADFGMTPYSSALLTTGRIPDGTGIVIDEKTKRQLEVGVGDSVQISFQDGDIPFTISGISQTNKFSIYPTAVVLYTGKIKDTVSSIENLSYTGAFVRVNDTEAGKKYFYEKYRALGKVGERSWYNDDESYEFMKKSIEGLSVEKEITNIDDLRQIGK